MFPSKSCHIGDSESTNPDISMCLEDAVWEQVLEKTASAQLDPERLEAVLFEEREK